MNVSIENFMAMIPNSDNDILNSILDELQDYLISKLSQFEKAYTEQFKRPPSDYDNQIFILTTLYKLIDSVEKYLKNTDKLISIKTYYTSKGTTVNAIVERDGLRYTFDTEVILAGGYNIQTLHNRYIVRTNIPRTDNNEMANLYKTKIKKLEGTNKIQSEISILQKMVSEAQRDLEVNSKLTDDEILTIIQSELKYPLNMKWDMLNDYAKEMYIDDWNKNDFLNHHYHFKSRMNPKSSIVLTAEEIKSKFKDVQDFFHNYKEKNEVLTYIDDWKWSNIHLQKHYIKEYEKTIIKLQKKLNQY